MSATVRKRKTAIRPGQLSFLFCYFSLIFGLFTQVAAAQRDDNFDNWNNYRKYGTQAYDYNSSKQLEQIASSGDAAAAFEIGLRCLDGDFLKGKICPHGKSDPQTAMLWLHKAADLGYSDGAGEYYIGLEYSLPAHSNDTEALFWLNRSVQHGSALGMTQLARFKSTHQTALADSVDTIALYRRAAEQGSASAMIYLGEAYLSGHGVTKDIVQADDWFAKADSSLNSKSDGSAAHGELTTGNDYLSSGETTRAIDYLLRAARQPPYYNPTTDFLYSKSQQDALQLLGEVYRDGRGVPPSPQKAQACFDARQSLINQGSAHDTARSAENQATEERNRAAYSAMISSALADLSISTQSLTTSSPAQNAANGNSPAQEQAQHTAQQRSQQTEVAKVSGGRPTVQQTTRSTAGSGAASPPTCVDLGPGNCMPLARYQQLQSQNLAVQQGQVPTPAPPPPCPTANSGLLETQPCVPASCISMNHVVHLQSEIFAAAPKEEREVVGYFTNNSISDVTCTWAFHKDGQWAEIGTGYVKKGATHQGGQGGGVWTVGADSYDMKYSCFMGIDPVDAQGHYCTLGVVFSGQTSAGTDIR